MEPKQDLVKERTVQYQGDTDGNVQQRKSIQQEDTRSLRYRCDSVEGEQEQKEPEDRIDSLDRKFGRGEEKGEERDMPGHSQGPEGPEVSPIFQSNETEGNDDEENRFLVNMPTKEKGRISAESDGTNKRIPVRSEPKLDQTELHKRVSGRAHVAHATGWSYQLEDEGQRKSLFFGDLWKYSKSGVAHQTPSNTTQGVSVHRKAQTGCNYSIVRVSRLSASGRRETYKELTSDL